MLRNTAIGIGGLIVGYVLGTVIGFNKGIEYHKDKLAEQRTDEIFANKDKPAHIDLTLESKE